MSKFLMAIRPYQYTYAQTEAGDEWHVTAVGTTMGDPLCMRYDLEDVDWAYWRVALHEDEAADLCPSCERILAARLRESGSIAG